MTKGSGKILAVRFYLASVFSGRKFGKNLYWEFELGKNKDMYLPNHVFSKQLVIIQR